MEEVIDCTSIYVFDVDGTLTPSRSIIDSAFKEFFLKFCQDHTVYIVTGSAYEHTLEQLGEDIAHAVTAIYNCNGSIKTVEGVEQWRKLWNPSPVIYSVLGQLLEVSKWTDRYPTTIDCRGTMINFSSIGRSCPQEARDAYFEWDNIHKERETVCHIVNLLFPEMEATIGGQISVDITPKGANKSTILDDIDEFGTDSTIYFFGDRTSKGGNDYPLSQRIRTENKGQSIQVDNWKTTYQLLKQTY